MKLALISDLHFGTVPEGMAEDLCATLNGLPLDLVVIAGDLTQRPRKRLFAQASSWLQTMQHRFMILPGNHDLPYWNLPRRFLNPYGRYRAATGADNLMPFETLNGGAVLGFNTTRSWQPHWRWPEGVARHADIERARALLNTTPVNTFKVVAAHHPFLPLAQIPRCRPVLGAKHAISAFVESGVELVLTGHLHLSFAVETVIEGRKLAALGAPTALSWRRRGEENGFWIIEDTPSHIHCELWLRQENTFSPASIKTFERAAPQFSAQNQGDSHVICR